MNEPIALSGVPETMLQTVYARAKESEGRGAIRDPKAEELIGKLNYDFSLADKDTAMRSGVVARTIVLDRLVSDWLAGHSDAAVGNIACGLDTRCYRMRGYAHWYNLDLPEVIAVREKLLPESGAVSQIAMSAMDDWGCEDRRKGCPGANCDRGSDHVSARSRGASYLHRDRQPVSAGNGICGNDESYDCQAV